jgi:selenocysteine lyase/cysteine desulfurase
MQAKEIINELLQSGITVHSRFVKDVEIPLINLDWGATNRPIQIVDSRLQTNYKKTYGNPNSCGTLTGETARDLIDKTSENIFGNLMIDPERYQIFYGGDGSSYWLERLPRILSVEHSLMEVITLQEELHNSLVQPWLETPHKLYRKKNLEWLERFIQYRSGSGRRLVLLITLSSHLTGYSLDVSSLMQLFKSLPPTERPILIVDATCYLSHHVSPPPDLEFDFLCFSGHKFPGGPGSCGAMISKKNFLPPLSSPGTPNVMSIVRLGLSVQARTIVMKESEKKKDEIDKLISDFTNLFESSVRSHTLFQLHRWDDSPHLLKTEPVYSFSVYLTDLKKYIHPQVVSSILLNVFGVQIRAGGQCADFVIQKEGPWSSLAGIDDQPPILHPSLCRISLPRYLLSKEIFSEVKSRLIDFLYISRFMVCGFYPQFDGWRLHPDVPKYVMLKEGREIEFTGRSQYCGSCQEKRDELVYSLRGSKDDKLKSGLEIYHVTDDTVLRHLRHESLHPQSDILHDHPFRWFVHPKDDVSVDD